MTGNHQNPEAVIAELEAQLAECRRTETLYRFLVEAIPDLVWLKDPDGVYISCNAAFERLFGVPEKEIVGKTDHDFVPADQADFFRRNDVLAVEARAPRLNEEWLTFSDGYLGLFETIKTPMHDDEGNLIGVLGVARDVTARHRIQQDLRESEERFRSLHDASFGGIGIHDKGIILECNQGLANMTGFTREELTGMDGLLLIAEESRDLVMHNIMSGYELPYEVVGLRKDGTTYPIRLEGRNVPYKGKQVRTVEFRDITEIKLAEKEQQLLQDQLAQAQKMESVGQLAGGIAHDFNNLLQAIMGYCELARMEVEPENPAQDALAQIYLAGERARTLIAQLLAFSRRQVLEMKNVVLDDVIRDMLLMLRRVIGEHVELDFQAGAAKCLVHADAGKIGQIITNLCVNARDAMPSGGTITLSTEAVRVGLGMGQSPADVPGGSYLLLSVRDNGVGMDRETREAAFEPFFTTKDVGVGTGLGLSTVYGLVKQHLGYVELDSTPGQGTVFRIYLPRVEGKAHQAGESRAVQGLEGKETVLLAEDEALVRDLARRVLERSGYTVLTAVDGEEALALFQENSGRIDGLLLDVMMPRLGGRAVYDRIRETRPDIPALFASGYSMDSVHDDFVLEEGLTLIQKPYSATDLLRKLRDVLDASREERSDG